MTAACAGCGYQPPEGTRFCGGCGAPLPAEQMSVRPAEGERKQVTVMFVDVAGSMDLAERLDPDELTQVMQGLFALCAGAVERFGGTVDKFTGDGVMALFGAPVAQEDHALRGCHAALAVIAAAQGYAEDLRVRRGLELAVRVGLNSGEVVTGAVGTGWTAVGHTVGLAQRMEAQADPGSVCVSPYTAALVQTAFELSDLGERTVKGSAFPLRVHRLEGALAASAARRRQSGSAGLIGRDAELAMLKAALVEAQDGRTAVIGIVAEAGAGKSRLCEELARHATTVGVTVRRTAGLSHAGTVALLPIRNLFRDYFGVGDTDSAEQTRQRMAGALLGLDPTVGPELGLIFDFLGVPDPQAPAPTLSPEARLRRVVEVTRRVTAQRSEQAILLLILEDLHWFDPASVEFLEAWLPSFEGTRTLVVTNFRPEFGGTFALLPHHRRLPLSPLDNAATDHLLAQLLGADPGVRELCVQLSARCGGNPLFAEEIVRSLAEDGTLTGSPTDYRLARPGAQVRVPATVQTVLASRIDRLGPSEKSVLAAAAVLGREFNETVLGAALGGDTGLPAALKALCAAELVTPTGAGEYRFWHPLTQEVAYGTLLAQTRRRLHQAAGDALVELYPERRSEFAALIATHFEAAEAHLEAARWNVQAGLHAIRGDMVECGRRMERCLDHLSLLPETEEVLRMMVEAAATRLRVGGSLGISAADAAALMARARPAAEKLDDPTLLTALCTADGVVQAYAGELLAADQTMADARRHAQRGADREIHVFTEAIGAWVFYFSGRLSAGHRLIEHGFELCGDDPETGTARYGYSGHAFLHIPAALLCGVDGNLAEGARCAEVARAHFFDRKPFGAMQGLASGMFPLLAYASGRREHVAFAVSVADLGLAGAVDSGSISTQVEAKLSVGIAALLEHRAADAVAVMTDGLAQARMRRPGRHREPDLLAHLARAHLDLDEITAARAHADEAPSVAHRQGSLLFECHAQLVRAHVYRRTATSVVDLAVARACVEAGNALAEQTGARTWAAFLAEEAARLDGDPDGLRAAACGYEAIGAIGHAERVRAELARPG